MGAGLGGLSCCDTVICSLETLPIARSDLAMIAAVVEEEAGRGPDRAGIEPFGVSDGLVDVDDSPAEVGGGRVLGVATFIFRHCTPTPSSRQRTC